MAYVIAEPCIGTKDTACVDACPVDCIHPKQNTTYDDGRTALDDAPQLYIDPVECIDCGACVPVCPVSAIFALDDLLRSGSNITRFPCCKNPWVLSNTEYKRETGLVLVPSLCWD